MKIVYCFSNLFEIGGMQRIIISKINYFVNIGYEIIVLVTESSDVNRLPYYYLDSRVKVYNLGIDYKLNRKRHYVKKAFYFFYNNIVHKKKLQDFIDREDPDIVISVFGTEMSILPYIKHRCKKILEFHTSRNTIKLSRRKNLFLLVDLWNDLNYSRIINRYDKFILLTNEDRCYWNGINNIQVIYNMSFFRCNKPSSCEVKKVISVGRYAGEKGFDRLINAWSIVEKCNNGWTLHIIGEGPLRNTLQKQIDSLGLSNKIFLDGLSDNIIDAYINSSIFVMTSHNEGFPLSLVEAESAGIPLISFDTKCGPKDLIKNGHNGFIISEGDINGLAEKILLLINDDNLRKTMGINAYNDSKKYSEEYIMPQWVSLFNSLLVDNND